MENDTLSFANLNDTYAYFKRERDASKETLPGEEIQTLAREYQAYHEPLDVNERSLSVYKELISSRGTNESL